MLCKMLWILSYVFNKFFKVENFKNWLFVGSCYLYIYSLIGYVDGF